MKRTSSPLRALPIAIGTIITVIAATACSEEKKEFVGNVNDRENTPTMMTRNVETFISDSGYTRYRIVADLWYIFEEAKEPRWTFPKGLSLQTFDNKFKEDGFFTCDSATYLSEKKRWRFDGNVKWRNTQGDRFMTEQLFWDQNNKTVYSDSFIHIQKSQRIIEGYGFRSNETMTDYIVKKPSGIFPIPGEKSDSIKPNTTAIDSGNATLPKPVANGPKLAPALPAAKARPNSPSQP